MSTLNVVSRKFRITVSEYEGTPLDISSIVEYFDVGDDRVGSSGLIPTRGTIKIRYNPVWNEGRDPKISLDPKIPESAKYWRRGEPVKIWIDDSTLTEQKHPRHSLRILKSKYDRYELSLTLEVGCLLALLDGPYPPGDESKTCVNQKRMANAVIHDVLMKAGTTYNIAVVYLGFVPGFISSPQEKGGGGSYVSFAGAIAYSRGYALWVTKDEEIKAIKIAPGNTTTRIVLDADRDVYSYARNDEDAESNESPYSRIRVRYNLVTLEENPHSYTSYMESFGASPSGRAGYLIATVRVRDEVNHNGSGSYRIITTTTQKPEAEVFPWIFTEQEIIDGRADGVTIDEIIEEIYEYERNDVWKEDKDEACPDDDIKDPKNQGRLLSVEKTIKRQLFAIKQGWASQHKTDGWTVFIDPKDDSHQIVVANGIAIAERETTHYGYFDNTNNGFISYTGVPDYSNGGSTDPGEYEETGVKVIQTQRWVHEGYVYPKAWAFITYLDGEDPSGLIYAGRDLQTWNKRLGRNEWEKRTIETRLIGQAQPGIVEARLKLAMETDYLANSIFSSPSSTGLNSEEWWAANKRQFARAQVREFAKYCTTVKNQIEVSSTQCQPPSPEYVPERFTRTEEEHVQDIIIVSPYSTRDGRVKEITLDSPIERYRRRGGGVSISSGVGTNNLLANHGLRGIQDDLEQARILAEIESLTVWGRFRAIETTYDLRDVWFDLPHLPMTRFDIIDRDRVTDTVYRHSYVVDGWANAVTLRECLCSHDGLWLGTSLFIKEEDIQFDTTVTIPPNATAIAVKPLPFALQEGDGVVIKPLAGLTFAGALTGSSVALLTTPVSTEIPAGTQVLIEGQVMVVRKSIPAGSSTLEFTKPLNVPISSGASGTAGVVAVVSMFTPIGSTAIPVLPTTNTETLNPATGIVNVQTQLLTTQTPQEFTSILSLVHTANSYEKQSTTFESVLVVSFPNGNYQNIGTATFSSILLLSHTANTNPIQRFGSTVLLGFTSVAHQESEFIVQLVHSPRLNISQTSEFTLNLTFTSPLPTISSVFPSTTTLIFNPELTNQTQTFTSILSLSSSFPTQQDPSNSFHLIAIW